MRNALVSLVFTALVLGCVPSEAQSEQALRRIVASGAGAAVAVPDLAFLKVDFKALEASPQEALAAGAAIVTPLVTALQKLDIEERDIQSNNLQLQPKYGPDGCGSSYAQSRSPAHCSALK